MDKILGTMSDKEECSAIPKQREELLKWNGWGYKDSKFIMKDNVSVFTGNRYPIGGGAQLPLFADWVRAEIGLPLDKLVPAHQESPLHLYPEPNVPPELVAGLKNAGVSYSSSTMDRLNRSHGHTMYEIFTLRHGVLPRIVDLVVWPESHDQVVAIVQLCTRLSVAVIPVGGATSVSGALLCPTTDREQRPLVALDTTQMWRVLSVSGENLTARCQAGVTGQQLERQLQRLGYTCGHEPDSLEFSSLGGWVATRASGMKKNTYGNIEDILVSVSLVTPRGVLERRSEAPRVSAGPDLNHTVLGSEGILGVVTEVTIKVRPVPTCVRYGALLLPDLAEGVRFLRHLARERAQPASVRLMDNEQFRFGRALKTDSGTFGWIKETLQKAYLLLWKRLDFTSVCLVTLLFEGSEELVSEQEKRLFFIASKYGGISAGEVNGQRGYMMTYVIAYIRDFGLDYELLAESFETSVPWDRCLSLCNSVKRRLKLECKERGIEKVFVTCRVTQTYDAGAVVYFYFAFGYGNVKDPIHTYEEIESAARDEVIRCGGSVSHHHGVGKVRQKWMTQTISKPGVGVLRAAKRYLDPDNVFASGNLIGDLPDDDSSEDREKTQESNIQQSTDLKSRL